MANWKYTLDFRDFWNDYDNGKKTISEMGILVAKRIKKRFFPLFENELEILVDNFENIEEVEDFNYCMGELYDWADEEIKPYGKWPRNAKCWIKTSI